MNQIEKATHMDLNGDGRIGGGGYGHAPPYQGAYGGAPGYPPQHGPYQGGYPPQQNYYAPPPPAPYGAYGAGPGYAPPPPPHHSGGPGGGFINQLERMTHMDLNGDGRIGGGQGYPPQHHPYGRPY